ncbi:hypothetical protein QCE49_24075 [Caballeronia sp. LZ008]|uniref:hypothetical protein n=1 Tax=unclassified Caballeronia TaxID=2646786 RepID=UPI002029263F|nr:MULTISPECIES: hypothetical protein [unclassified Caballeronia]MDR5796467.1 hypothetical protein [Caballeronia sp. LZ008]
MKPSLLNKDMNPSIDDAEFTRQADFHPRRSASEIVIAQKRFSSYSKLLEGPVSTIAGNVPERADATSVAILGYN